ncbi:hypothetical protein F2Q69_00022007 [Brassica cretica]|uniref:RNase H type-1 domain-containing protein n=1 Tax=Brassica cretica TaxID=69181 RepID=A0A8S9QV86_BRACR|nr:hypothetical protein F2Q69_00022007 [Brassica cretica]
MSEETILLTQRKAISWILWTVWKNRNIILYADTQESITIQVHNAIEEASIWSELNTQQQVPETVHGLNEEAKKWEPPLLGYVKCNIHSNWRNAKLHSGVAYIIRDPSGNVLHHARDALTFSPNIVTSEFRCLVWALQSMENLGYQEIVGFAPVVSSDFKDIIEAVKKPNKWPLFRVMLQKISSLCARFRSVAFEAESSSSNQIARNCEERPS